MPVVFFLTLGYYLIETHLARGYLDFQPGPWLVLMFVYAMFIPNSWRRAAVVIGVIAATPLALVIAVFLTDPRVADVMMIETWTRLPLMLGLTWAGSVFGVYTIGTLRREAFEARQLGQYRLKRRIGAGGMGEVYLAEHQLMKRPCVIKLIRPDKAGDARSLARFQREVRATAKLSHWNTVEIFDYGSTADGTFYYVMEYLPGMSLAELVDRFGPMPAARVVHLLWQTCDALGEAHSAGLIHRDIKPGNIFAAHRGGVYDVAKLLDFGLVKPSEDEESLQLTTEGAITGSPLFMSPEQAIGDGEPDARSDIYSLGAVGYFLLTGHPPFEADKAIKVMIAHAHEEVIPPSQRGVDVPEDLELVILRCLAKKSADRYQDAASLGEALAACDSADGWSRADARAWWEGVP
jgi:eukaryotic-like serine/threonine-protein kinase